MQIDTTKWSGEGTFTERLIETLKQLDEVAVARVEDAPSTRSEVEYNFISNEIFLGFRSADRVEQRRWLGVVPVRRRVSAKTMSLARLERVLAERDGIGPPDYADEGMLQYLRTERVVPPYQTRGYKLVELVRIYEMGTEPRR